MNRDPSLIGNVQRQVEDERARYAGVNTAVERCRNLLGDYGRFDNCSRPIVEIPAVRWDDESTVALWLLGSDGRGIEPTGSNYPTDYWLDIAEIRVMLLPVFGDGVVSAKIRRPVGVGVPADVLGVEDFPLPLEQVRALNNDLERYRSLIKEGKLEDRPPLIPSRGPTAPDASVA